MEELKGQYENRLAAFINILGFSALVSKRATDPTDAEKLFNALMHIQLDVQYNEKKKEIEKSALEMA